MSNYIHAILNSQNTAPGWKWYAVRYRRGRLNLFGKPQECLQLHKSQAEAEACVAEKNPKWRVLRSEPTNGD